MKRSRLSTAVAWAIVIGVLLTTALYILSTRYLIASRWPWQLDPQLENVQLDTLRLVLSLVAGIGAVMGLVIAYRRQNDLENHRFTEEFTNAVRLMASEEIVESIAGVHAMVATINSTRDLSRRQQGVDQLCGYLRLGTDVTRDPYLSETLIERDTVLGAHRTDRKTFKSREADLRRAVISALLDHLPRLKQRRVNGKTVDVPPSRFDRTNHWLDCKIDLRGADLSDAYLMKINLRGAWLIGANLSGAKLPGADLTGARLIDARLTDAFLYSATLTGVWFQGASLEGADLSFTNLEKAMLRYENGTGLATWDTKTKWPARFDPESRPIRGGVRPGRHANAPVDPERPGG